VAKPKRATLLGQLFDFAPAEAPAYQMVPAAPEATPVPALPRIPIAAIDPNPDQPRKGKPQGIEELAASIEEYGLLQPIVVRAKGDGRYTCIAGHRRLAAYKHLFNSSEAALQWAEIPAIERDTHSDDLLVMALLENLSRQDLSESDIITSLRLLHDLRGWSQREIARRLGVTSGWINQFFRVASDPQVGVAVQAGEISVAKAHAIVLAKTPEAKSAALEAGRNNAPLQLIRQIAKGTLGQYTDRAADQADEPHSDYAASGGPDAGTGGEAEPHSHYAANGHGSAGGGSAQVGEAVATASADAGVRDLAELAEELGLTMRLEDLQLFRLVRAAIVGKTEIISVADVLRLARADLRKAEAVVRSQPPR
jgi:ParB/RepB/Spo0J family partition protein